MIETGYQQNSTTKPNSGTDKYNKQGHMGNFSPYKNMESDRTDHPRFQHKNHTAFLFWFSESSTAHIISLL